MSPIDTAAIRGEDTSEHMPTVEVILPAYNAAQYLPKALDSVIAQTFPKWRILLVDDGSTDDTAAIAAAYAERLGPKLKYIRQDNTGLPGARNTAIRHAEAEFLALLDADDIFLPHRLEASVRSFAGRPEVGLSYGLVEGIDTDGAVFAKMEHGQLPEGSVASQIYMRTMDLPCPTVTFRRAAIARTGMFDETLRATEDRDLWVRIAQLYKVAYIPDIIAQYRTSPHAMTTDPERMFTSQLRFIEKHFRTPGCGPRERRIALSGIYRQRAEALARRGRPRAAVASGLRALALYPLGRKNARTAAGLLRRWIFASRQGQGAAV